MTNKINARTETTLNTIITEWCESLDKRNFQLRLPTATTLMSNFLKGNSWKIKEIDGKNWAYRYGQMVLSATGLKLPPKFLSELNKAIILDS